MHQGLTAKILMSTVLLLAFYAVPTQCLAQLNNSDEIIETIEDIQIQDDSGLKKKEDHPSKPKFDEEFGKKQSIPKEEIEEQEVEEQKADRKEIKEEDRKSYENELEKNARKNRFERREISPEDLKRFEVDAPVQEVPPPVVGSPQEPQPAEPVDPEEQIEQEITDIPEENIEEVEVESVSTESKPTEITPEEPAGPAIYYPPEETGPTISYQNEKKLTDEQLKNLSEKTKVEIEDDPYVEGTVSKKVGDYLKSFKERRPPWTYQISVGANQFVPINYESDAMGTTEYFEDFYNDSAVPSPEISFEIKKNFSWASIAMGVVASYYSTSITDSDFTLTMPSVEATVYLDTLFDEPYVVPYGTLGYTYMMYDEKNKALDIAFKGETDNVYASLGILIQLDWLDPTSDTLAYTDMGIENTFLYVEGRTYLDQGFMRSEEDPDFSTSTHVAGGIKLEF